MPVTARPHSFSAPQEVAVPPGSTLLDIVRSVVGDGDAIVQLEGEFIPREMWRHVRPKHHASVAVTVPLHDGSNQWINALLSIVVIAAAPVLAPAVASTIGVSTQVATAFVSAAGLVAVNALFPVRPQGLNDSTESPTYSISGARNDARPFRAVPVVLGTHRHTPPLGARSYTEIIGGEEYLRLLLVWGYGPLSVSDIKIGATPIESFSNWEQETRSEYTAGSDSPITLFPGVVQQEQVGVQLRTDEDWTTRTTEADIDEFQVDLVFPQGLIAFYRDGSRRFRTVTFEWEWRQVGGAWISMGTQDVKDVTTSAIRFGIRQPVTRGQYEVRFRRTAPADDQDRRIDALFWTSLRSIQAAQPIQFRQPLTVTALRIKATNQLSGVLDNLSATLGSEVPVWNGSDWSTTAVSRNPAALYRHVLTGPANARPRTESQLDDAALGAWYEFCEAQGYTYNRIHDAPQSVWDTCADIASAGRAAPALQDGRWSVIVDTPDKPVTQHFTPRNSWGFRSAKGMPIQPHAWRVRFVNEQKDYQQDEMIVYDDGYSASNATNYERIEFPGVTDPNLVWKFGRYHIAQARLRPEEYSFYADFEHLACQRGDVVRVSHDVTLWGDGYGRVTALETDGSGDVISIAVDERLPVLDGESYNMRFRLDDGSSLVVPVTAPVGENTEFTCDPVNATLQVGDLFMFGRVGVESARLIVKRIERAQDLVARIVCVDEASAIYDADTGTIPAFDSVVTDPVDVTRFPPAAPGIASVESGTAALVRTNNGFLPRILVSVERNESQIPVREWQVRFHRGAGIWTTITSPVEDQTLALSPVETGETYEIQARAISSFGVASAWSTSVTERVLGEDELPDDVTGFAVNVVGTEAHLSWEPVLNIDLSHYRIKWTASKTSPTWDSATDIVLRVSGTSTTVPAQVGSYLIKAVDHAGNESENADVVITSIASLSGLNIVEVLEEPDGSGDWLGTTTQVEYDATLTGVRISYESPGDLYAEGYYQAVSAIDLGEKHTSRVTGALIVSGQDLALDLYDFADLYDAGNLYGAAPGSFRAAIDISTTDDDPAGTPTWSDWKRLVVGDYSARAYRFRVYLAGDGVSITPVLTGAEFEVDMPDRLHRFSATIASGGTRVAFDPAFYAFPDDRGLGITVLNGQEGDKYTITNLDKTGFDIAFTNGGSNVSRNISGIAQSYGELNS